MLSRLFVALIVLTLLLGLPVLAQTVTEQEKNEGFAALFNGKDLTGWVMMDNSRWEIVNGVIACPGQSHGWLRSAQEYEDFILRLDYNISKGGNSGIFIRATETGNPAFSGMEIQVLDDHGKEPNHTSAGSLYAAVRPTVNASKPAGEWNEVEIVCIGRALKVTMNGQRLYAVNLDDTALNESLPEDQKLNKRVPKGFIGMQAHGDPVWYRNIRIKDLGSSVKAAAGSAKPTCCGG